MSNKEELSLRDQFAIEIMNGLSSRSDSRAKIGKAIYDLENFLEGEGYKTNYDAALKSLKIQTKIAYIIADLMRKTRLEELE